jgi:hypothetical protein
MLYLLAIRSLQNRDLIKHLERTNVAPLAQQLATAEAFQSTMLLALQNKATAQQLTSSEPTPTTTTRVLYVFGGPPCTSYRIICRHAPIGVQHVQPR